MRKINYTYVTYRPLTTDQEKADAIKDILAVSFKYQKEVRSICKVEEGKPFQESLIEDIAVLDTIYDAICNRLDYDANRGKGLVKHWVDLTWYYCRTRHEDDHAWSLTDFETLCERYINTPDYNLYEDLKDHGLHRVGAYLITYLKDALAVVYHALDRRLHDQDPFIV